MPHFITAGLLTDTRKQTALFTASSALFQTLYFNVPVSGHSHRGCRHFQDLQFRCWLCLISSCKQTPEMRSYSSLNLLFFHIAVSHNEFLNTYALFLNSSFCHLYQFQSFFFKYTSSVLLRNIS